MDFQATHQQHQQQQVSEREEIYNMWDIPKLDKNDNPCFKCDKRHATCHATCRAYNDWLKQHQRDKKKQRLKKYNDNVGAPNVHNPNYNNN